MALTQDDIQLAVVYIKNNFNQAQTAEELGYAGGASSIMPGLAKPEVKELVDQLTKTLLAEDGVHIKAVLQELATIAFLDMGEIVTWGTAGIKLKDSKDLGNRTRGIVEVTETVSKNGRTVKVRAHDKLKALELIGRAFQMFVEKKEIVNSYQVGVEGLNIGRVIETDPEAAELACKLLGRIANRKIEPSGVCVGDERAALPGSTAHRVIES